MSELARLGVPRSLPAPVSRFTGRRRELAALTGLLDARDRAGGTVLISAIGGTAGVGKTALAVHWAHQVADRFPDGQLYVNLRGFGPGGQVMDPGEAVRGFLETIQVPPHRIPTGPDDQIALYRSVLAGRRVLIILDNARDAAQVRPLLPGTPGCLAVVTSRNDLADLVAVDGARPITLDLFTPDEARELLADRLGADRVGAQADAAEEIAVRCARLPLALAIVTARAAIHPEFRLAALAAELRGAHSGWAAFADDDPATDVRTVFSWSYRALTPAAARLFRLLGLHPGPDVTPPAVASLAGLPPAEVRPLLAELARAHLVGEHRPDRYAMHDLLRAYAHEQAGATDSDEDRRAATHRALDHYLHTAYAAERFLDTGDPIAIGPARAGVTPEVVGDDQRALAWFTAEQAVLTAAIRHAGDAGFDAHAWQLAWAVQAFLDVSGRWQEMVVTGRTAAAAAHRLADPVAQARCHRLLAYTYSRLSRFDEAHAEFRRALDLHERAGDVAGQAAAHRLRARLWDRQGRHGDALDEARQALELYRCLDDRNGQANILNDIGWYETELGDYERALADCRRALALHEESGNRTGQADTWDSLGYAHQRTGDNAEAIACYRHALALLPDDALYYRADTLVRVGDCHAAAGAPAAARDAWRQALGMLEELDHPDADQVRAKVAGDA